MIDEQPAATLVRTGDLQPAEWNPRTIDTERFENLRKSIREDPRFLWARPILAMKDGTIYGGNMRYRAAIAEGWKSVPAIVEDLTIEQAKIRALRDNGQWGEWQEDQLAELLHGLAQQGDVTALGFDEAELERLLALVGGDGGADVDGEAMLTPPAEPISKRGDVWILGDHRVMCGDATSLEDTSALLEGELVDFSVSSPPYNVGVAYAAYRDRAKREEYLGLIAKVAERLYDVTRRGRFVAWNVGVSPQTYPHHHVVRFEEAGFDLYRQIVWQKVGIPWPHFPASTRARKVRHYKPNYQHEVIYVLEKPFGADGLEVECPTCGGDGKAPGRDLNLEDAAGAVVLFTSGTLVEYGATRSPDRRYPNDVWTIQQTEAAKDLNTVSMRRTGFADSGHAVKEHPAVFPIELPRALMGYLSGKGEIVYDPFAGAGTTLLACEELGRRGRAMELDPGYVDVIVRRWSARTGKEARKA